MPPVHTELVRRAIRIVCEMVIAELREVLLQKKRKLLEMKSKKTIPAARRKIGRPAPQPINFVNVEGMNADEGVSEGHTEPQTDPWANITIKEELQDDELTFEEHFDNMDVKTEVKEEMSYETTFAGELNLEASSSGSVKLEDEDNEQEEEPAAKKRKKGAVATGTGTSQEPSASSSFQSVFADQAEKPYVCKKCYKTFATFAELKEHSLCHKRTVTKHKCNKCGLKFAEVRKLKKHLLKHKVIGKKTHSLNTCKLCKRSFSVRKNLKSHKLLHYKACSNAKGKIFQKYSKYYPKDSNMQLKFWSGQTYKCEHCVRRFVCISNLVRHAYIHNKPQRFACPNITRLKMQLTRKCKN